MSLQITCPHCSKLLQVGTQFVGQTFACPQCGGSLIVPLLVKPPPITLPPSAVVPPPHPTTATTLPSSTFPGVSVSRPQRRNPVRRSTLPLLIGGLALLALVATLAIGIALWNPAFAPNQEVKQASAANNNNAAARRPPAGGPKATTSSLDSPTHELGRPTKAEKSTAVTSGNTDPGSSEPKAMQKIRETLSKRDIQQTFLDLVHTECEIKRAAVEFLDEKSVEGTKDTAISIAWVLLWRSNHTPEGRTVLLQRVNVSGDAVDFQPVFLILQSNAKKEEVTQLFLDITKKFPLLKETGKSTGANKPARSLEELLSMDDGPSDFTHEEWVEIKRKLYFEGKLGVTETDGVYEFRNDPRNYLGVIRAMRDFK